MSYSLEPYAIDIAKLKQAVGSKDAELVGAVINNNPESFADEDAEADEMPLSQALRELINGDTSNNDSPHQYGYALMALAAHLGEKLEYNWWCGVGWAALEETGLDAVIEKSGCPVQLPPNPGTFPIMGFMPRDEVLARVAELGEDHFTSEDDSLQDLLDEYEDWLRAAAQRKLDILFFYY